MFLTVLFFLYRNNTNHYFYDNDNDNIINNKILKLLEKLNNNEIIKYINKKFGNCNLVESIIEYLNKIYIKYDITDYEKEDIDFWWE